MEWTSSISAATLSAGALPGTIDQLLHNNRFSGLIQLLAGLSVRKDFSSMATSLPRRSVNATPSLSELEKLLFIALMLGSGAMLAKYRRA